MAAKRLEVLHELVPGARTIGLLTNPTNRSIEVVVPDVHRAADTLGLQVIVGNARSQSEFDVAFENFVRYRTQALLVDADAVLFSLRQQIIALAARHSLPTLYVDRLYVEEGGLISYGASITDAYREAGIYAGKILNGVHPANLPVLQPTQFELRINLKTAKALGLQIPLMLLARADEVIE